MALMLQNPRFAGTNINSCTICILLAWGCHGQYCQQNVSRVFPSGRSALYPLCLDGAFRTIGPLLRKFCPNSRR